MLLDRVPGRPPCPAGRIPRSPREPGGAMRSSGRGIYQPSLFVGAQSMVSQFKAGGRVCIP